MDERYVKLIARKATSHASPQQAPLPTINYTKLGSVTSEDKKLIQLMAVNMKSVHGHMDLTGMVSDRANGMPLDELMLKECSKCGVPRNKKGRKR
jgi:hypothetical protein